MAFILANRGEVYIKAVVSGLPGAGKSYTAIKIASCLAAWSEGIKTNNTEEILIPQLARLVAVIESENRSREYAGGKPFHYSVEELVDYGPQNWSSALEEAKKLGFRAVVLDSFSDEWKGRGGCLELVDRKGGSYRAWGEVKAAHWALIEQIQAYPGHVLVTVRNKTGIDLQTDPKSGKTIPVKTAPAPIQEDEFAYRLSHYFDMSYNEEAKQPELTVVKSVAPSLKPWQKFLSPGYNFSALLWNFCQDETPEASAYLVQRDLIRRANTQEELQPILQAIAAMKEKYTVRELSLLRELGQSRLLEFSKAEASAGAPNNV